MPDFERHHLDQKDAARRKGLWRILAMGVVASAVGAAWLGLNNTPSAPPEIDALIAPPLYANGAVYALTENGKLHDKPARILTLQPGARLMVRVQNPPNSPRLIWRDVSQPFTRDEDGTYWSTLTIDEPGVLSLSEGNGQGRDWLVSLTPDNPPVAKFSEKPFISSRNMVRFAVEADDDFGLESLELLIAPASDTDPGPAQPIAIPFELIGGDEPFRDTVYIDLRDNVMAGQMARAWLAATDRRGQKSLSEPQFLKLPERRYRMAEARILASQPEKLYTNPAKTAEVATILHTIVMRHMEENDLPSGKFLGFAVAYNRLTDTSLISDREFRPPLLPANKQQIEAASELIMALASAIEDGPLAETDRQFMTADRGLQDVLTTTASPEDQEVALWQYRFALSRHLPALLFNSLQRQGHFLPSPHGNDVQRDFRVFDELSQKIATDIDVTDWQRARDRLAILRDIIHNAQAGTVSAERDDLLGLIAELGSMQSQISQLRREVQGELDPARTGKRSGKQSGAISVRPFAPLNLRSATARSEALYYRAKRRLDDDRIVKLMVDENTEPPEQADTATSSAPRFDVHQHIKQDLFRAQSAFNQQDSKAALSYLNQAEKKLAALTKSAIGRSLQLALHLPPTHKTPYTGAPISNTDYERFMALLSAHRAFVERNTDAPTTIHDGADTLRAQFNQAMKLTLVLPPVAPIAATPGD